MCLGYETLYQASTLGNVRRLHKDFRAKEPYKILKPIIKNNYANISLSKNGIVTQYGLHYIIAITFIPNPYNKPQVNHKDGDKLNNIPDNLEWVTCSENMIHAYKNNLMENARKATISRLSKPVLQYDKSGTLIKEYKSVAEANKITGIHYGNICTSCKTHLLAGGYKWEYKNGGD